MNLYRTAGGNAKIMLVVLTCVWGVTWPLMKIALNDIPPFSMRVSTAGLGALTLVALMMLQRRSFRIPRGVARWHVFVAGLLNIAGFSLCTAFGQLSATTSRVAILTYTMPIWAALMARPILGERFTVIRGAALALCAAGLTVLMSQQSAAGVPTGMFFAIGAGVSWAAGTVYLKWARIDGDPLAVTTWQLVAAFVFIGLCLPVFEGSLHLWPVRWEAMFGLWFTGVLGCGFAYVLWFEIVRLLPAMTASLGVLSVPAIGVVSSVFLLGDRPTVTDMIGFALIFAAAVCVLVPTPAAMRHVCSDGGA